MALVTSESEGSSVEAEASAVTEDDSMSSEAELVPGEWLRACSKCSFQRGRATLNVIEYFAKSPKVTQGHLK